MLTSVGGFLGHRLGEVGVSIGVIDSDVNGGLSVFCVC